MRWAMGGVRGGTMWELAQPKRTRIQHDVPLHSNQPVLALTANSSICFLPIAHLPRLPTTALEFEQVTDERAERLGIRVSFVVSKAIGEQNKQCSVERTVQWCSKIVTPRVAHPEYA